MKKEGLNACENWAGIRPGNDCKTCPVLFSIILMYTFFTKASRVKNQQSKVMKNPEDKLMFNVIFSCFAVCFQLSSHNLKNTSKMKNTAVLSLLP